VPLIVAKAGSRSVARLASEATTTAPSTLVPAAPTSEGGDPGKIFSGAVPSKKKLS
jgi:hypothetical protein